MSTATTALPSDLPSPIPPPSEWESRAACAGMPTDLFFAEAGSSKDPGAKLITEGRPMRICARCPVRRECLTDTLKHETGEADPMTGKWRRRLPTGVFGGCSAEMRHHPRVRHREDCATHKCRPPCRPLYEAVDMLDAWHRIEARKWLSRTEEVL